MEYVWHILGEVEQILDHRIACSSRHLPKPCLKLNDVEYLHFAAGPMICDGKPNQFLALLVQHVDRLYLHVANKNPMMMLMYDDVC